MNHLITYRKAEVRDLDSLIALRIQFTTLLTGIADPERVAELKKNMERYFKKIFTDQSSSWVLAFAGEQAVATGGMIFRENPPNFKNPEGRMAYMVNMYTIPEYRRRGICSAIIQTLIAEAQKNGIKAFELHATKEGEPVYLKEGFEQHDEPTYRKYLK